MQKLIKLASAHKVISAAVLLVLAFVGYREYQSFFGGGTSETRYVVQAVERGTLVSSVSGTGQISVSNQFDVKPNVSGNVVYLGVSEGQKVNAGTLIARLDDTDAQKAVRDAEINLQSAQLSLQQLQLSSANMDTLINNAFSSVSNTFLDFPTVISDAQDILLSDDLNPKNQSNNDYYTNFVGQSDDVNYRKISLLVGSAMSDYSTAKNDYDSTFILYKNTSRYAAQSDIETLLQESIKSATSMSQALKSEQNILDFLTDYVANNANPKKLPSLITTYKATLKTDIGLANSHLSDLTSVYNSIQNAPLNVESQQLSIQQKQNALADAKANLDYYYIRAPFSGIVAQLNVKNGDPVSPSTAVATMINFQKVAEISLNEVDVSKVKTGQKATLTFDALPDLTVTGKVTQVDTIGTVTQGVVTYNVQITLETDDSRIKPGMSVSASIITDVKNDVLLVPNSAVKSVGNSYYVQVVDPSTINSSSSAEQGITTSVSPSQVSVQMGESNNSMTEITAGLNEGDMVVTQTITASAQAQQSSSALRIPGITSGGGGGIFRTGTTGR